LQSEVRKHVEAGAALYLDALLSYSGTAPIMRTRLWIMLCSTLTVASTRTAETFWSLLKRGISGTYVSVEPFHLFRYLDEQTFRYNNRKDLNDGHAGSLWL